MVILLAPCQRSGVPEGCVIVVVLGNTFTINADFTVTGGVVIGVTVLQQWGLGSIPLHSQINHPAEAPLSEIWSSQGCSSEEVQRRPFVKHMISTGRQARGGLDDQPGNVHSSSAPVSRHRAKIPETRLSSESVLLLAGLLTRPADYKYDPSECPHPRPENKSCALQLEKTHGTYQDSPVFLHKLQSANVLR
ncbi:hypothetical protein EYF80_016738 [Liparis tanakae]|uniref:Uncharacterized protein n=1 Tax=Liparis tanakae TaxID=230148 RepID=A0A4Z2I525_9TELE|nr:hypothetical protein EYF80_016738 [Liparis tanakae]